MREFGQGWRQRVPVYAIGMLGKAVKDERRVFHGLILQLPTGWLSDFLLVAVLLLHNEIQLCFSWRNGTLDPVPGHGSCWRSKKLVLKGEERREMKKLAKGLRSFRGPCSRKEVSTARTTCF